MHTGMAIMYQFITEPVNPLFGHRVSLRLEIIQFSSIILILFIFYISLLSILFSMYTFSLKIRHVLP